MRGRSLVSVAAVVLAICMPTVTHGQGEQKDHLLVGAAPFLTRDRGWNFENNIAVNFGVERDLGPVGIRLQATVKRGGIGYNQSLGFPAENPSVNNGVSLATLMVIRSPYRLYGMIGPEWFGVAWQNAIDRIRRGTFVGSGGLGMRLGPEWSVESRYGQFANRLGTTQGHLELGVVRYLDR